MRRIIRALVDGLLLRCPRCHRKSMFERGFSIRAVCPHCGQPFESASGEVTGGMGINITVTLVIIMGVALVLGLNPRVPLLPLLFGLGAFAVIFPIVFYRPSRGLWVGLLYLTGNAAELDSR
jgi:uncharacterized protein (DUF983 family)